MATDRFSIIFATVEKEVMARGEGLIKVAGQPLVRDVQSSGDGGIFFANEMAKAGEIYWVEAPRQRRLRDGKTVPDLSELSTLEVQTRCPEKWAAVDMETGEIWVGTPKGWSRATKVQATGVLACMKDGTL